MGNYPEGAKSRLISMDRYEESRERRKAELWAEKLSDIAYSPDYFITEIVNHEDIDVELQREEVRRWAEVEAKPYFATILSKAFDKWLESELDRQEEEGEA